MKLEASFAHFSVCSKYRGARTSAPVYHAAVTTVTLLVTAFIGSLVSGAVLAYLVLMVTLMLPGLHRSHLNYYIYLIHQYLSQPRAAGRLLWLCRWLRGGNDQRKEARIR